MQGADQREVCRQRQNAANDRVGVHCGSLGHSLSAPENISVGEVA